jgi:hypothetical protein
MERSRLDAAREAAYREIAQRAVELDQRATRVALSCDTTPHRTITR